MKNIAKADRPKSAMAILPPRPFRRSGKVAQAAFKPARRDGKSFIPSVNHFSRDSRILKISPAATFRIAGGAPSAWTAPYPLIASVRGECWYGRDGPEAEAD